MPLYDISLTLSEDLVTWPTEHPLKLTRISSIDEGGDSNVTQLYASVHMGTHVDAPDHFLNNQQTVEEIPLDLMVGPAAVIAVSGDQAITAADLREAEITGKHKRILLKTENSKFWTSDIKTFQEDFLALDASAAQYLVDEGVEVVGIDYLSIAPFSDPEPTHRILLEAGVLVIESLDLSQIDPGEYTLLCLPLKIGGAEGAPARVLLQD